MDLRDYERAKFELAAILRDAAITVRETKRDIQDPFKDLFARLAEDRFNLLVVGRFSRGKTSLMNAMLDTDRLPTGIVPLTSVITTVSYGSTERALIEYEGWSPALAREVGLDALPDFVTQQHNPGNQQRVALARVELPLELLRRGFHLVDTPGLGSSIVENTRTTERFLPEADAFMLVTSYDSPFSEEELRVLQMTASSASRVFLVVNKQDIVSLEERNQVLCHVRDQARRVFGEPLPQIFSISAREAVEATKQHDFARFALSGISDLKEALTTFLLNEKQAEFLLRMCERAADALHDAGYFGDAVERLHALHRGLVHQRSNNLPAASPLEQVTRDDAPQFSSCSICAQIDREFYKFLCQYQYDISARRDLQTKFAENGGLCPYHIWQYESVASPRGTCVGFSTLLERLAARLREIATASPTDAYSTQVKGLRPTPDSCDFCRAHADLEGRAVAAMARSLMAVGNESANRFSGLCLDHLHLVLEAIPAAATASGLLIIEANILERVSEDMRRYALKFDGVRRFLSSKEELSADARALLLLAGHRNVNSLRRLV